MVPFIGTLFTCKKELTPRNSFDLSKKQPHLIVSALTAAVLGVLLGITPAIAEEGLRTRLSHASEHPPRDTADAVLVESGNWQWNRYLNAALNLPRWLDLGLDQRTRFEVYDHPWRVSQTQGRTDPQIQQRTRVRVGLNTELIRFLFEGQDARVHLTEPGDFVNESIKNEFDILQALVSLTAKDFLGTGLRTDLHVGRLTMDIGHRRLIARNEFRNTTNAFDGIHWQLANTEAWRFRAFLVEPVIINSTQLDEQSARYVFWGTFLENHQVPWLRFNLYYFGLNDQRSSTVTAQRTFSTFGLSLYERPRHRWLDYELESVLQAGHRGNTKHLAHFHHVSLGYTFDYLWEPRFQVFYDYASGDRNPNDSQDSAFDSLFGARRFEYMPTGNFGPFFRTNISSPGWRLALTPANSWKFQLKHRIWYLATARGAFGSSAIRDQTGSSGNFLGHDIEVRLQWAITSYLEIDAGYDQWFKGSYFNRLPPTAGLPPGGNKDTDYFYVFTNIRF